MSSPPWKNTHFRKFPTSLLSDFCEDEGLSDLSANAGFAIVAVDIRAAATTTTITGIVIVVFLHTTVLFHHLQDLKI